MGKAMGSEPLGRFYSGKKAKKRREWRGLKDTWYDYVHWLGIWKTLIGFMLHLNNLKAFFRYRWMVNYLAVPDFLTGIRRGSAVHSFALPAQPWNWWSQICARAWA